MLLALAFSGNNPLRVEQSSGHATCSSRCSTQQGQRLHTSHAHRLWHAVKLSVTGLQWPARTVHVKCQRLTKLRVSPTLLRVPASSVGC